MVERERNEGDAKALSAGPLPQEGVPDKTEGERGKEERDGEDDRKEQQEEEEKWSEIRLAVEELSPPAKLKHGGGMPAASPPPTLPFLGLSHLLLRVLDKIGPTMAVLRLDVQRNIERLQELYLLDPPKYSTLTEIVEKEVKEGTARKVDSCARAVLWLTRSMDFTITLLQRLEDSDQQSLAQLVEAAYTVTLKPWHGWISSAAYKIAMKLIPERKIFTSMLVGMGQDGTGLKDEIEKLALLLQPLLDDIHSMMAKFRLDKLKST
ncbi:glycolipid transfer protein 3-like [Phragmites australis]|uniref:glycolipid transfer protein 3-like n=1 Tax=Phragmites australis TaxID=29695 RepID=UPI002D773BEC|nr:glycolipid transfer protein 3-like [Phragmites australis]